MIGQKSGMWAELWRKTLPSLQEKNIIGEEGI